MIANSQPAWAAGFVEGPDGDRLNLTPEAYLFLQRLFNELPEAQETNAAAIVAAAREAALAEVLPLIESQQATIAALQARLNSPEIPDASAARPERIQVLVIQSGSAASYPAASFEGAERIDDDTYIRYEGNNGSWVEIIYPAKIKMLGGDATFPMLKRSTTLVQLRLADDSDYTDGEVKGRAYNSSTWNGSNRITQEDSVRDKFEQLAPGLTDALVNDAAYGAGWDTDTTHAPSRNAVYDKIQTLLGSSAYTPTNVTTDRSYDADATSTAELADVLGTLIGDLQGKGILS